jgi:hypothetical protein
LTASDATQFAWEGDKVIGETDNSLFTHFLVKGLEGEADSDGDGLSDGDELAKPFVSQKTPPNAPSVHECDATGSPAARSRFW